LRASDITKAPLSGFDMQAWGHAGLGSHIAHPRAVIQYSAEFG